MSWELPTDLTDPQTLKEVGRLAVSVKATLPSSYRAKGLSTQGSLWPRKRASQVAHLYEDDELSNDALPAEDSLLPPIATVPALVSKFSLGNNSQQRLTEQFWHLEPGIDKITESGLRQLVSMQLTLLEKGNRVVSNRDELISLATAEAYTFLIHYLHALFGLRAYDPKPEKEIKKRKREYGNWTSCLNACTLMNFPPELLDKVTKRIERLQQASERWRRSRFKDANASADERDSPYSSDLGEGSLDETESMQDTPKERASKAATAEDPTHDTATYYDRSNG